MIRGQDKGSEVNDVSTALETTTRSQCHKQILW